jgi:hypothetical protein
MNNNKEQGLGRWYLFYLDIEKKYAQKATKGLIRLGEGIVFLLAEHARTSSLVTCCRCSVLVDKPPDISLLLIDCTIHQIQSFSFFVYIGIQRR